MPLVPAVAARARCAAPEFLPIVDAAFKRPGGPEQHRMETHVCPECPIWDACLRDALDHGEHGPWGGTSERERRKHVRRPSTYNLSSIPGRESLANAPKPGPPKARANTVLLTRLGFTAHDVKQWALATGVATTVPRGVPSRDLIEAYASAHERKTA